MKGKYLAVALGILIILVSLVSACGGSNSTATQTTTATNTATATTTHTATATATSTATSTHTATATATTTQTATSTPTGNTLSSILGLGANITHVYYEMNLTSTVGGSSVVKVWEKGKKVRDEMTMEGMTIISIMDGDAGVTYTYNSVMDSWTQTAFNTSTVPEGAAQDPNDILDFNPEILGTETIDGKSCTVIQWTIDDGTIKEWIWTEKGFPLKMETVTPAGTTTIEFTNIDFSDIPNSMFELPEGVTVTIVG